MQMQIILY